VIVCVLDMTSNLTNQNAIDMAKEADPAGRRTLGVVTKPDRAVSADTNALDQLGSGVFQMGLGFVVVSCRRQMSYTLLTFLQELKGYDLFLLECCCASAACLPCSSMAHRDSTSLCLCDNVQAGGSAVTAPA